MEVVWGKASVSIFYRFVFEKRAVVGSSRKLKQCLWQQWVHRERKMCKWFAPCKRGNSAVLPGDVCATVWFWTDKTWVLKELWVSCFFNLLESLGFLFAVYITRFGLKSLSFSYVNWYHYQVQSQPAIPFQMPNRTENRGCSDFFHSDSLTSAWANPPHLCTSSSHPTAAVQAPRSQCGGWTPCTKDRKIKSWADLCTKFADLPDTYCQSYGANWEIPMDLDLPRAMVTGTGLRAQIGMRFLQSENL